MNATATLRLPALATVDARQIVREASQQLVEKVAQTVLTEARQRVPPATAGLVGAGALEGTGTTTVTVAFRGPIAPYIHGPMDGSKTRTRPHWPPPGAVDKWATARGIPPFLVARAISRRGTPMTPFLAQAGALVRDTQLAGMAQQAAADLAARLQGGR